MWGKSETQERVSWELEAKSENEARGAGFPRTCHCTALLGAVTSEHWGIFHTKSFKCPKRTLCFSPWAAQPRQLTPATENGQRALEAREAISPAPQGLGVGSLDSTSNWSPLMCFWQDGDTSKFFQ